MASFAALFFIAVIAGALNALSGGGTFLVFPSLLLMGLPAVSANATTTVALTPGVAFSALAYRNELRIEGRSRLPLVIVSFVGGGLGALLLLKTPSTLFEGLIPFLLLFATLVLTFGPTVTRRLGHTGGPLSDARPSGHFRALLAIQFAIAVYGGYFGGGIGILMLAVLTFFGMKDFHSANALRTVLAASVNGVAVVAFILAGAVAWPEALIMLVGAIIGGYSGVRLLRRIQGPILRRGVIGLAVIMTVYFFWRAYH